VTRLTRLGLDFDSVWLKLYIALQDTKASEFHDMILAVEYRISIKVCLERALQTILLRKGEV
jgi:hypothetical protein